MLDRSQPAGVSIGAATAATRASAVSIGLEVERECGIANTTASPATTVIATFRASLGLRIHLKRFTKSSFAGIGAHVSRSTVHWLETSLGASLQRLGPTDVYQTLI